LNNCPSEGLLGGEMYPVLPSPKKALPGPFKGEVDMERLLDKLFGIGICTLILKWAWNEVCTQLFSLPELGWWQAFKLTLLIAVVGELFASHVVVTHKDS